jgi:tetratricopeptide (TPR) repeat protein
MNTKKMVIVAIAAFVCGEIFAQEFNAQEFQGRYRTVMASTKQDMREAVEFLNGILEADPSNPEALIYKGSILSKIASADFWFWQKLAHVNEGIDLMARGMELLDGERGSAVPEERKLTMYINRGVTCASIPRSFRQVDNALLELERAREHEYFQYVDNETKAKVLGFLSKIYRIKKMRELAEQTLQEAKTYDPVIAEQSAK